MQHTLSRLTVALMICCAVSQARGQALPAGPQPAGPQPAPAEAAVPEIARRTLRVQTPTRGSDIKPTPETLGKAANLIADVMEPELVLEIRPNRSKLVRMKRPVTRASITDPNIAEITQLSPTEFEVIGAKHGETTLTLWFGNVDDAQPQEILRYLVVVVPDAGLWEDITKGYSEIEQMINEMFPDSQIQLVPIADKLVVRGQARDASEAAQIMGIVRGQASGANGSGGGGRGVGATNVNIGSALSPFPDDKQSSNQVINMLRVPGEQQVLLKVRVAELSRTALRELGINFTAAGDDFFVSSTFNVTGNVTALFSGSDINLFIKAVSSNGSSKVLAEPNLVTLSGQTASFIAGGQFAVPTAVGVNGVQAATTFFQGFGTQLLFTPTVLDKDLIRLQVCPTFSTLNNENRVNGIPGLNTRSVNTTVDMRAGQWFAIAGLLQDEQQGASVRIPYLGDIPFAGALFSTKRIQRNETELVVLVSPELVHPLEAEQMPLFLPGMDVTEPGPVAFYGLGMIEGFPDVHHRSTVFPNVRHQAQRDAMRNAKGNSRYQRCENFYVNGAHGFSE